MNGFIFFMEMVGTVAFAASGTAAGIQKHMDIFGVAALALATAVGGGVIRDLILGNTPPETFRHPLYAAVAILTALALFFSGVRRLLERSPALYDAAMFWMDTAGLASFTVVGVQVAYANVSQATLFLLVFVGTITGVGGGILRDVMAGEVPCIFVKHVYSSASLAGALTCGLLWKYSGEITAMSAGCAVVFLIRILSAHYRWNLPRA